ncbi:MAG: YARHG domain-containing protein [Bacteroidales bacterium]|nr:YARHG domain-containing protein [Bacteroidales bacterium]
MKKIITLLICCLSALFTFANDGVFYASGNQLIPITETDISVKKEVLTINRVANHLEVNVYYEFFNPVGEKDLLVGFEAMSPYNGLDPIKAFPNHPHIRNFKVIMNGETLPFEIAHVETGHHDTNGEYSFSKYYVNGQFKCWSRQQIEDTLNSWYYPDMPVDYVYHFKAHFRPGLNIIQHTYDFDLSSSVEEEFYFPYVLTAANRWANHQIDDFHLQINLGDHESFHVFPDFFKSADEWEIIGRGKITIDTTWGLTDSKATPVFHIQQGGISFRKTNFHPEGDLNISQRRIMSYMRSMELEDYGWGSGVLDAIMEQYQSLWLPDSTDDYSGLSAEQRRILKNLPFAYRGYIFKSKELQNYFESTPWYIPNPDYNGNMEVFTNEERKWVEFWK